MGQRPSLPPDAETIRYQDLLARVNTGDLLLYSGRGFDSSLIRCWSLGLNWSHIGVIVVKTTADGRRFPCIIESNPPIGQRDLITGMTNKSGPQMVDLATRIKNYSGFFVSWRPLRKTVLYEADPQRAFFQQKLIEFAQRQRVDAKYDYNPIDLWGAVTRSNTDSSKNYFCTEFVAAALVYANILQSIKPCENYSLDDFSAIGYGYLPMQNNLSYERELYLELPVV